MDSIYYYIGGVNNIYVAVVMHLPDAKIDAKTKQDAAIQIAKLLYTIVKEDNAVYIILDMIVDTKTGKAIADPIEIAPGKTYYALSSDKIRLILANLVGFKFTKLLALTPDQKTYETQKKLTRFVLTAIRRHTRAENLTLRPLVVVDPNPARRLLSGLGLGVIVE